MGDLVKLDADFLRGPMAVAAGKDEGAKRAVMVWDLDRVDSHWGKAYWAIEAISLTSMKYMLAFGGMTSR